MLQTIDKDETWLWRRLVSGNVSPFSNDLIAQHPAFFVSIQEARKQKAQCQARRLADLRQKYSKD